MPGEYKLKYSGEKIDKLLAKIDNLGTGNDTTAGILKLSDDANETYGVSDGIAATPAAVKSVSGRVGTAESNITDIQSNITDIQSDIEQLQQKISQTTYLTLTISASAWSSGNYTVTWDDGRTTTYTQRAIIAASTVTASSSISVSDRTRVTDAVRLVAALEPGAGAIKFYANAAPTSAAVFVVEVSQ